MLRPVKSNYKVNVNLMKLLGLLNHILLKLKEEISRKKHEVKVLFALTVFENYRMFGIFSRTIQH